MMKRWGCLILALSFYVALIPPLYAVEEVRPLGMNSANGGTSGDIRVGNTCTTSAGGKFYCGFNTTHMLFYADNTVTVNKLYPLAAGDTGFPYILGGTWTIDSLATYRGRLGTGTKDNTTYLRGDGTWSVPPGSGAVTVTTLPWDNITSTPTTLAGYGITDYTTPSALPWDNITRTLSSGVTDTELSYVDNVTSPLQTQLNAKQASNTNLTLLSSTSASSWKIFYSNGSNAMTELGFGVDNQCLISTGQYSAPEWGVCGSGSGSYDPAAGAITGGTIDNTVIGGTTPASITGTTGVFQTLATSTISNTELSYLDNATSNIQAQLNNKQALDNGTFTGEVGGSQFVSNGADNTFGLNVMNTTDPVGGYLAGGTMWYNSVANMIRQRSADNNFTYDVLSTRIAKFSKCFTVDNVLSGANYPVEKFPQEIWIYNIHVYQIGATNVVGGLDECTGTAGVCSSVTPVDADITGTNGVDVADDGSLSNATIAAGNWIRWHTTSVSGTNTTLSVCFYYTPITAN
jgi:hypothetical protein